MFFTCQVFSLLENFNIGIYSDTINIINVKLCMMVLLSDDLDHILRSQVCQKHKLQIVIRVLSTVV